jgi:hypothetical protein
VREGEGGWAVLRFISIQMRRLGRPEEEEGGHRVGHGPEWPGGLNNSWAGAERKQ